jgi:hypothetical protein
VSALAARWVDKGLKKGCFSSFCLDSKVGATTSISTIINYSLYTIPSIPRPRLILLRLIQTPLHKSRGY